MTTLVLFYPGSAETAVYKWKDEKGKFHFTDSPHKIPPKYREKSKIPGMESDRPHRFPRQPRKVKPEATPMVPVAPPKTEQEITSDKSNPPKPAIKKFRKQIAGVKVISVSLDAENIGFKLGARWNDRVKLSSKAPKNLTGTPEFEGSEQGFGFIKLGTREPREYWFALDILDNDAVQLYFDFNHNQDLSDDGPPVKNQGNGVYAAEIRIPFDQLFEKAGIEDDYKAWFFTNDSMWKKREVTYYSRTQWKGTIRLAGREFTFYLADSVDNDADPTNNGINIDLNKDGKINNKTEHFDTGEPIKYQGNKYPYEIMW